MIPTGESQTNTKIASELRGQLTRRASQESALRDAVGKALKVCRSEGRNRADIARELTTLTGEMVSKRNLDDWATPSKTDLRFPAWIVKFFCEVTHDNGVALAIMPDRLRAQVEVGKGVTNAFQVIENISGGLGRLAAELRQGIRSSKRIPKRRRR